MIPIFINTMQISEQFAVEKSAIEGLKARVLNAVVTDFEMVWKQKADRHLFQTRKRYKRSIQTEYIGTDSAVVFLDPKDVLSNAVEQGMSAFDMKDGFSKSTKRKEKKDGGWYLTIPFRWATPGTIGESEAFSSYMPNDIHKVAKKVLPNRKLGLQTSEIPAAYRPPKTRAEIPGFPAYTHKTNIYQGMIKSDRPNHSHYTTFRRVSDKSDVNSWIHTGINARNLSGKAMAEFEGQRMETIVQNIVTEFLDNL